jgi:hypothetical protein
MLSSRDHFVALAGSIVSVLSMDRLDESRGSLRTPVAHKPWLPQGHSDPNPLWASPGTPALLPGVSVSAFSKIVSCLLWCRVTSQCNLLPEQPPSTRTRSLTCLHACNFTALSPAVPTSGVRLPCGLPVCEGSPAAIGESMLCGQSSPGHQRPHTLVALQLDVPRSSHCVATHLKVPFHHQCERS